MTAAGRGAFATMAALAYGGAKPAAPRSIRCDLPDVHPVFEIDEATLARFPERLPPGRGRRSLRFAIVAASDALREAARAGAMGLSPDRIGLIVGATVGGMNHTEEWIEDRCGSTLWKPPSQVAIGLPAGAARCSPRRSVARRASIRHLPLWDLPNALASRFGFRGPAFAVSTACTSGAQAIATAADLISTGACDAVLAGGVDCLARLTYNGFAALGVMSKQRCAPFDAQRAGLNLGEGAAFLLLVRADMAPGGERASGRFALLRGWASNTDAHHATAPRPDGSGVAAAIGDALAVGQVAPGDVGWVHAHGTATPTNDAVEATGLRAAFGSHRVPVSSTKHVFGHTLGAAGAVAAAVTVYALHDGFVPGNAPIVSPDMACDVAVVPPRGLRTPLSCAVVSSLGFGGASCALVLSRALT